MRSLVPNKGEDSKHLRQSISDGECILAMSKYLAHNMPMRNKVGSRLRILWRSRALRQESCYDQSGWHYHREQVTNMTRASTVRRV